MDPVSQQPSLDARDARIEAKLIEWNLEFRYEPEFPLDQIRVAEWAQVRDVSHIAPRLEAEEYRVQMDGGAVFPPAVLMDPDVLIDGNTRVRAQRSRRQSTYPVYVVQFPTVALAKALAASLNNMGGKRLSADEAHTAAEQMMELQFTDDAIAREIGRSTTQVRKLRKKLDFAQRTDRLNLSERAATMREDDKLALSGVAHDPPFKELVDLVAAIRPDAKTVKALVKDVQAAESDSAALDLIHAARAEMVPAGPPPHRAQAPQEAGKAMGALGMLLAHETEPLVLVDTRPDKREEAISRWRRVRELADQVLGVYGATDNLGLSEQAA